MARQKGIIKLKGNIGDISFFKTKKGYQAREKTGVDANRIATDPVFIRTRENGEEFGSIAKSGKLLRDSVRPLLMNVSNSGSVQRLMRIMTAIKRFDIISVRGKRNIGQGITDPNAKALLKGFNFNLRSPLGSVLFKPFTLNPLNGQINITGLVPINEIIFPSGATHLSFKSAWSKVDFVTGDKSLEQSPVQNVPINGVPANVSLIPANIPVGTGNDVFMLKIEFFQEINGVQYSLKNGLYNVLCLIEII